MHSLLADIFPPTTKEQWSKQVQKDLKDEHVYESLRWHTESTNASDGFTLEPYYTAEDLQSVPVAEFQAAQKLTPEWLNTPEIPFSDEKSTNDQIRDNLSRGAEAILTAVSPEVTISRLLMGVKLSDTPVYFRLDEGVAQFVTSLRQTAPYQLKGGVLTDPIATYLRTATPIRDQAFADIAEATRLTTDSPSFQTVCASSHVFHNAGATATQEIAFLLASLADQYDQLTELGLPIDQLMAKTILSVSVGTSYFLEIAKLRALRVLLRRFWSAYTPGPSLQAITPTVHAQTSTFYDAAVTPYTNLLRATTEAMAAVIGGCNVLTVHPYNTVLQASEETGATEFAARIARNVSILLKEEAHLDKVADPSAGSYYIENATHQLVNAAWQLFLEIEQRGGFRKAIAQGFVQEAIERAYQVKVNALQNGRIMVGVNKFTFDEPDTQPAALPAATNSILPDRRLSAILENA